MESLEGKVALVTGASRGLGRDIALALARAGTIVVATARTESEGQSPIPGTLAETVQAIREAGGRGLALRCDVTNEEEVQGLVARTLLEFGKVDILVNNAGIQTAPVPTWELQVRHWDLLFRVNVRGPFLLCRAVIPEMMRQGGGHIINISSRAAIGPGPGPYPPGTRGGGTVYGTTKAALERFTQGLAAELAPHRIAVNALSPNRSIWSEGGHYVRTRDGRSFTYSGWRMSGEIMGDAVVLICAQDPYQFTGRILYDEMVIQELGGLSEAELYTRYPVEP
jgi:citronellol/citronellal dehydrogenase